MHQQLQKVHLEIINRRYDLFWLENAINLLSLLHDFKQLQHELFEGCRHVIAILLSDSSELVTELGKVLRVNINALLAIRPKA